MTIQYSGPAIDPEMPWEIRRHIQLLYQKLGNHTQAFQEVSNQIAGIKGGTTTTIIEGGGGSTPVPPPPSTGFLGQGLINDQSGQTSYATGPGDNGILLILNDASPVSVTLTTAAAPYYLIITNFGAGTVTLSPSTGFINGGASLSLLQSQTVIASCDSTNWKTTAFFTPPANFAAVAHEFLTAYDSATGVFTAAQPVEADVVNLVSDLAAKAPLVSPALTGVPSAPTAAPLTDDTQVATTAYADAAVSVEKTRAEAAEALLAPLDSPTFTGTVTQPAPPVVTAATTDTSATAGAATALPATPAGYMEQEINGTIFKIPYYSV